MRLVYLLFLALFIFSACASYRQNIMFKPTDKATAEIFSKEALHITKNYVIQKNDLLKLDVFSNKGERLIDPNPELSSTHPINTTVNNTSSSNFSYLVDLNGIVKFPMVGELKLEGLTLRQAEEIIQKEYDVFFKESFVILNYVNKRVVLLGALGGQVIPLTNQNITLIEVLALGKGLNNDAKADRIKLIRGDHVYQIDFSTIQGYKDGNMFIESGDIVYVEPIRRPFSESLRDNLTIVSFIVSLGTLLVIIRSFN